MAPPRHALLGLLLALVVLLLGLFGPAAAQRPRGHEIGDFGRCLEVQMFTPPVFGSAVPARVLSVTCNGSGQQMGLFLSGSGSSQQIRFSFPLLFGGSKTECVARSASGSGGDYFNTFEDCGDGRTLFSRPGGSLGPGFKTNTNHCLDLNTGNNIINFHRTCNGNANQQFRLFTPLMLEFMLYLSQSRCMAAESAQSNAFVRLADCNPNDARQLWAHDRFNKMMRLFGTNLCLREIWQGSNSEIKVQTCDSTFTSMRWEVPATIVATSNAGDGRIVSNNNRGLNIPYIPWSDRLSGWVPNSNNLQNQRLRRWRCRAVPGHLWNTNDFCASCTAGGADAATGCTTCRNQWDLGTGCTTCLNKYSTSSDCTECQANWDFGTGCTDCENRWNKASNCLTCDDQFDPASDCTSCRTNWNTASDCKVCDLGFNINTDCLTCAASFNSTTNCDFCEGVKSDCYTSGRATLQGSATQSSSIQTPEACQAACARKTGCTHFSWNTNGGGNLCVHGTGITGQLPPTPGDESLFGPKYCTTGPGLSELSDCQTCRNMNWDLSTGCASCSYAWNETKDCLACDNTDIDPSTNCTTCKFSNFDYSQGCQGDCINPNYVRNSGAEGCAFCKNGFNESGSCSTCRNSWTGASCDNCAAWDEFSDCTEAECECGEDLGSCSIGGVVTSIWVEEEVPQPWLTNETNITVSQCAEGVTPKDIYRHLSCASESLEGLSRAFDCTAKWLRTADLSNLTRADSYVFDGILARSRPAAFNSNLPVATRAKAAQLTATWQVIVQQGRGHSFVYRYPAVEALEARLTTNFTAPPVPVPLGTTSQLRDSAFRDEQLAASIQHYLGLFKEASVLATCKAWFRGFGQCECGSVFVPATSGQGRCERVAVGQLANLWSAHLFCSVADGVVGTGASVELIQRTGNCIKRELWKDEDHETLGMLLKTARASATASAEANPDVAAVLGQVSLDLTAELARVGRRQSAKEGLNARSVAVIKSADVASELEGELEQDLRDELTKLRIADSTIAVTAYMNLVAGQISSQMDGNLKATTRALEGLGDLILSSTSASIATTKASFSALASAQRDEAVGNLGTEITFRNGLRSTFLASQTRIEADHDQIKTEIERMFPLGEELGEATKVFYECKRDQELAALARKRAMAIFDIVVGCIEIVSEAACLAATAGACGAKNLAKSAAERAAKAVGEGIVKNAKQNAMVTAARNGLEQYQDNAFGALPKDKEAKKRLGVDALRAVLGESVDEELDDYLATGSIPPREPGDTDQDRRIDTAVSVLKTLDTFGVPFVGGAAHILKGANVLANYGKMKDEINGRYEASMAKSREVLDLLGELVAKMGEFAAEMMLEYGQLMIFNVPAVSIIESRSKSFWRATQNNIISFAKSTEMYQDFKEAAKRRALVEAPWGEHRQLLASLKRFDPEAETDAPETRALLESRAGVRGAKVESTDMRRALDSKKADCNLGNSARDGLKAFDNFFKGLDEIVFFSESLHENLLLFLGTTRDIIVSTSRISALNKLIDTYDEAIAGINADTPELLEFGARFQEVLQLSYQRSAPEIASIDPQVFNHTAATQDGFMWQLCNAARYKMLQQPASCNFYMADVMARQANSSDLGLLGGRLESIKSELNTLQNNFKTPGFWTRIPVASTLDMRNTIGVGKAVLSNSTFAFSLDGPPPVMTGAGCGYNHQMLAYAFVLETRASNGGQLHPAALEEWYSYRVQLSGPFIKLDAFGNRHAFLPIDTPTDFGGSERAVRIAPAAETDCSAARFSSFKTVEIRNDVHRLCIQSNKDDFGIAPVTPWGTTFNITLLGLASLVAEEALDLELVMYAELSTVDMGLNCPATDFFDRKLPSTGSASGTDAALIVGVSLGAVALAAAGAFAAKKYLATRSAKVATAKMITTGGTANPMAQL